MVESGTGHGWAKLQPDRPLEGEICTNNAGDIPFIARLYFFNSLLEVKVESESDARGFVGIPDIPTALGNLRKSVTLGAEGVDESQLRDLAAWGEQHSPVGCTLRNWPAVAVEVVTD